MNFVNSTFILPKTYLYKYNTLVFYIGSTFANNCSRCDLDYNLYPRLEETNGKLQEDGESCHYEDRDDVDTEQDIKNEASLFALSKRYIFNPLYFRDHLTIIVMLTDQVSSYSLFLKANIQPYPKQNYKFSSC
jgi:hypothetical protein